MNVEITRILGDEIILSQDCGPDIEIRRWKGFISITVEPSPPIFISPEEPLHKHLEAILNDPEVQ